MILRIALGASLLAAGISAGLAQPSEAYVNQIDRSAPGSVTAPAIGGGQASPYIMQVPETARPVAPRPVQRRAPARATASAQRQPAVAIAPARQAAVFPSIGSGVALALSQAAASRSFPDVGAGVGAP